jgi:hypothetical protein
MKPTNSVMEERETMATLKRFMVAGVMVLGAAGTAAAQVTQAEAEQIHQRQQVATMETVLQQAVVHGADLVYAQFRSVFQDRPRLGSQPRVSGYLLPGYGMVFNVDVPMIQLPLLWDVLVRDAEYRNGLAQLQRMRQQSTTMPPGRERDQLMEQINRGEQQLGLGNVRDGARIGPNGVPLVQAGISGAGGTVDQKVSEDPETVYSREVKEALIDAMLTNSQGLRVGPDEWLTVTAMARETNSSAPGQSVDSSRGIIRVKGSVLSAYRAGTITKEEARKQVEILEQ